MTASEQNGIDILCDAAGSDMLLSSLFSLASPNQQTQHLQQQPQSLETDQQQSIRHQTPRSQTSSLPSKRKLSDASPSSPTHVCHICKRVYERADHLTRHLRSHENARPYQCSRCPKRFNRADLLTRHETTHDRDGGTKGRPFIRRSDRAAEACLNCAASKAKCEDQKPCSRCRNKSLTCQMPPRRGQQYRTSDGAVTASPSESSTLASIPGIEGHGILQNDGLYGIPKLSQSHDQPIEPITGFEGSLFTSPSASHRLPIIGNITDDVMYFNPIHNPFHDMDFSLDLDLKEITISRSNSYWLSSQATGTGNPQTLPMLGLFNSDAAFRRSAWIFEPRRRRSTHQDADGLAYLDQNNPSASHLHNHSPSLVDQLRISPVARDRLFTMALAHTFKRKHLTTFPSLEVLSYFLQAHFAQDQDRFDTLFHASSFDPENVTPELLSAIVSSGATHISIPAAWQFGLALDDVTHLAINDLVRIYSFGEIPAFCCVRPSPRSWR